MIRKRRLLPLALATWLLGVAVWIGTGPAEQPNARADVAIVLGAAVNVDRPSPVFQERIRHGVQLWRSGRVRKILFTGGKAPGDPLAESQVARHFALSAGIPDAAILTESKSRTTMQNLVEAQSLMRANRLGTAIIVSDPLHMRRSVAMAASLRLDAVPEATPTSRYRSWSSRLPFLLREIWFLHYFWVVGE